MVLKLLPETKAQETLCCDKNLKTIVDLIREEI